MIEILVCPYCHTPLIDLKCNLCNLRYYQSDKTKAFHIYDTTREHWQLCLKQIEAVKKLDAGHEDIGNYDTEYPYGNLENADLGQRANAGMFNVARDLLGESLFTIGYGLDIGSGNGWVSLQLSKCCPMIAFDITDHCYYGNGAIPSINKGIYKIVADGCVLPFSDNSIDFVIMVSSLHHLHDRKGGVEEVSRVLKPLGKFIAIGECYQPIELFEQLMNDGIRDYEGVPYTKETLYDIISTFRGNIEILPFTYSDHMEYLGYYSLVNQGPASNNIIYGIKHG